MRYCELMVAFIRNKFLTRFISQLPEGARVLDVGCGTGKTLLYLASARPDLYLYAVDINDVGAKLPSCVDFQIAKVEELVDIFQENLFDAVICQHVIEHLQFPMKMLDSFKKILKPGGVVYFETPNWTRLFIHFSFNFFWNDYTHIRPYSKMTFKRLLSNFNFTLLELRSFSSAPLISRKIIGPLIPDVLVAIAKNEK